MRISLRGACLVFLALLLTGCEDWEGIGSSDRYKEDFHFSYPLNPGGKVQLENMNGSVEITGWDKDAVDIDGTKYANTEQRLREIKIDVAPSAGSITIRTVPPLDRRGNAGARYVIHVPRRAELASIVSSNGSIRVDTIDGHARLKTSNGAVRARRLNGSLDVQTSNGSVEVSDVVGDTVLHSSNGGIHAEVKQGSFEATTSNGGIDVRLMEKDANPVRLESSNGHIDLTMDAAREVHAGTSNSSIVVRMPASAAATVRAHTSNASITSDFDVSVRGVVLSKHRLEGSIGGGGPLLDLATSNGGIKLLRQ